MPLCFDWGWRTFQTASHVYVIHIWDVWAPFQDVEGHMASHLPCYHHRCFLRFVRVGWNPTWFKVCKPCHYALVEAVESFKLHPMTMPFIYEVFEHLLWLCMGIWFHTHTVTTTDASPDLERLAEILRDESVQTMPLRFGWGCGTFQTASHVHARYLWGVWVPSKVVDGHMASHSHCYHQRHFPRFVRVGWNPTWCKYANHATTSLLRLLNLSNYIPCPCNTYMRCLSTFSGYGWVYGFTFSSLPPQTLPQICESWLKSYVMQVCKPYHYILVEAVEPFKLHPMSMPYIYEVFECLLRLWMGIWLHIHIITTTDASPDLGKLAEILPFASLQIMPLRFGCSCKTFQTASHIHVIHVWGVWGPSQVVHEHMASHSHRYHHRHFPRFVKVGWKPTWYKCANHATTLWLRL